MSAENKSRLEVQKLLRESILEGLSALGVKGWEVMEYSQPNFTNGDKVVLMNMKEGKRIGWQGRKYLTDGEEFKRIEEWIDEQSWELHMVAKRKIKTTGSEILAEDVASALVTWFSGPGVASLRNRGLAPLRVSSKDVVVYDDDNDIHQKRAVFTMKIQVPKQVTLASAYMSVEGLEIYGI